MKLHEMKKLVQLNAVLGIDTDPAILEQIAEGEALLAKEQEEAERQRARIASKFSSVFAELSRDINSLIAEKVEPPKQSKKTLIDAVVEKVTDTKPTSVFVQPDPPTVGRDIQSIQNKLKLLEGWVGKIAMTGPGGGAGSVDQLDHKTTAVVADSYHVGRHDYYIGVDYPDNVAIYLPTTVANGRVLVIKDESGSAAHYPITVVGRVDNDPDGFVLKVNNGAVQLIYRNGWRII